MVLHQRGHLVLVKHALEQGNGMVKHELIYPHVLHRIADVSLVEFLNTAQGCYDLVHAGCSH